MKRRAQKLSADTGTSEKERSGRADARLEAVLSHLEARRYSDVLRLGTRLADEGLDSATLWHALGLAQYGLGDAPAGVELLERSLERAPDDRTIRLNLAALLDAAGRTADAVQHYVAVIEADPGNADCRVKLAGALHRLGMADRAVDTLHEALSLDPQYAPAHNLLATIYAGAARLDDALRHRQAAVDLQPHSGRYSVALADMYQRVGDPDAARRSYDAASRQAPSDGLRIRRALVMPVVAESAEGLAQRRRRVETEIDALARQPLNLTDPAREVAKSYFQFGAEGLDDRPFLEKLARLYLRACPALAFEAPHCRDATPETRRRRVGVVSPFLRDHTLGRLLGDVIRRLPRQEIELVVAGFAPAADPLARRISAAADSFVVLPRVLSAARQQLAGARLNVILYAGIGMDPLLYFLSFARLAPLQCMGWGFPITSGVPTMDAFLSSDLVEPAAADGHYSEALVRFPSLGTCYPRPAVPALSQQDAAARLGLSATQHVYLYPYGPYRFPPEFDAAVDAILAADPQGELVMLEGPSRRHRALLEARLARTAPNAQGRLRFLARRPHEDFLALYPAAHVMLDPLVFSGGNTSFEAFAAATPVVTLPGRFRRARLTYGMYRRMGLLDCVAHDPDDYVAKAVAIATDRSLREHLQAEIAARADALYEDEDAVRDHARFFIDGLGRG